MSDSRNLDAHLFVCTNTKALGKSCGASNSAVLRDQVKKICQDPARGWHGRVRINASGCLGRCEKGITAVLYPHGKWLENLQSDSTTPVLEILSEALDKK